MESYYKFTVSKAKVVSKIIWCWILVISIPFIQYNQDQIKFFIGAPNAFVLIFVTVLTLLTVSILASAIYNGIKFLKLDPFAELEVFNDDGYLIYRNVVDSKIKEKRVQLESIYFIKRNFCDPIYLFYDEIFYTENDIIKKIVLSITLVDKIEKKMRSNKQVKITEYHRFYYRKFPITTWDNTSDLAIVE